MTQQLTDPTDEIGVAGRRRVRALARRADSSKPWRKAIKPAKNGDDSGHGAKPMSKAEAMKLLTTDATVNPEQAGIILGLGRSSAYRAVRNEQIPSIQIGGLYLVSTTVLRRILETGQLPAKSPSLQAAPPKTAQAKPPRRQRRRRR